MRNVFRECSCLDIFGNIHLSFKALAFNAIFDESTALHRYRSISGKSRSKRFIGGSKGARVTIQYLRYSNERAIVIKQWYRQNGASAVASLYINGAIESFIGIGVWNVDDLFGSCCRSRDACRHGDTNHIWRIAWATKTMCHLSKEFLCFGVKLKHGGAFGLQEVTKRINDYRQN